MLKFALVFLFIALLPYQVFANTQRCSKNSFIKELLDTGDSYRAVTLLKEAEFKSRGTENGFECATQLLQLYVQHREFDLADDWLKLMIERYPQMKKVGDSNHLQAEMAYLFGNYSDVERRLSAGTKVDPADPLLNFSKALQNPYDAQVACSANECTKLREIVSSDSLKGRKSPTLALAFGIVPGMGQVYAGRTWSGIASFVLNSVLIGTTIYGFDRGEYAFATLAAAGTAGIYFGSLYAGYEATRRYNDDLESNTRAKIREVELNLPLLKFVF